MQAMKKYLKIILITLLLLIIALSGVLFTQQGNDLLKPYLKAELEKQVGLPVEVGLYKLRYDNTALKITIDNALNVDIESLFSLLGLSFDGNYTIFANNFVYNDINLKQANINGEFIGVPDDIYVNGKGNTFHAPINYYLRVLKGDAKEITIQLKDMNITDILDLTRQPAVAKGSVDANVTIPTLVKSQMNTHGLIHFDGITFNDALMKKHYKVTLPKGMEINGNVDVNLTDTEIFGGALMQSNIANVMLKNLHFNKKTKHVTSRYIVDILNLKALSDLLRTKLDGAILLQGEVVKKEKLKVTGSTKSLGGEINYSLIDNNFTSTLKAVPVKNMLQMFRFPAFVDAQASGRLDFDRKSKTGGTKLAFEAFRLASNNVTKSLGLLIGKDPSSIVFGETTLDAGINGDEIDYTLMAKSMDASIKVDEAFINKAEDTHYGKIYFAYKKYAVEGNIAGSVRSPRISFDTNGLLNDTELTKKAEKEIKRFFKKLF